MESIERDIELAYRKQIKVLQANGGSIQEV